jgi:putative hydrolase of the HAD superfamily
MPAIAAMHERHASHLFGLSKPGEAIYRRFETALGARGGEILFFDDLADNVATAERIGWDAVRIDHEGDTAAQVRAALDERGVRC